MIRKPCCSRFSLHKFVHLKFFWTQFKNVHLQGPCSLRPCISRPYCILKLWPIVSAFGHSLLGSECLSIETRTNQVVLCSSKSWTLITLHEFAFKKRKKMGQNGSRCKVFHAKLKRIQSFSLEFSLTDE